MINLGYTKNVYLVSARCSTQQTAVPANILTDAILWSSKLYHYFFIFLFVFIDPSAHVFYPR